MHILSNYINQTLISLTDMDFESASIYSQKLKQQLENLKHSCRQCHKDEYPIERILGKETDLKLALLNKNINNKNIKNSQKNMGDLAVNICARCHSIHKTSHDIRKLLTPKNEQH